MEVLYVVLMCLASSTLVLSQQCNVTGDKTYCVTEDILDLISKRELKDHANRNRGVFFAYMKDNLFVGGQDVFMFTDVRTNIDNVFNPSTGIYTAPENGLYQIIVLIMGYSTNDVHFQVHRNDELFYHGYVMKSTYGSQGSTIIMELQKGDHVYVKHRGDARQQMQGNRHSYFGGFML